MAKVTFQTVQGGFPAKGVDAEVVLLGQSAIKDQAVRVGPDHADTRQLLAALRTWAAAQTPPRKLKTRTVSGQIYWQILNEAPKKRSNGSSSVRVSQMPATAPVNAPATS
jgi:hypothetical protein